MRHLTPHQVDGMWRFATVSRRGGGPIGLCATDGGHETALEARECYAGYQRRRIHLDGATLNWGDCAVCEAPTKTYAYVEGDGPFADLCVTHLTLEHATTAMGLDGPAGDSWVS